MIQFLQLLSSKSMGIAASRIGCHEDDIMLLEEALLKTRNQLNHLKDVAAITVWSNFSRYCI